VTATSPALFLDRDGTIIVHKPYLHLAAEVELIPGAAEALRRARASGYRLFLFTNQSGVGRGLFPLSDVHAVHARMIELLALGPAPFDGICIAPEAPGQLAVYRKPSPRFIHESIAHHRLDPARCWMVGDTAADWQAGLSAGVHAAAVVSDHTTEASEALRTQLGVPLYASLAVFIARLLDDPAV